MRVLLQRVTSAAVHVNGECVGEIQNGLVALLGIGHDDCKASADWLADKISILRIFEDENGKTNLSAQDIGGNLMVISQFSLYADCRKGSRPGFSDAAPPAKAMELYTYFLEACRKYFPNLQHGIFGADMKLSLTNDGPFTVLLER